MTPAKQQCHRKKCNSSGKTYPALPPDTPLDPPVPTRTDPPRDDDEAAVAPRQAAYVSSKYRRDSGSAVEAWRLLWIAVLSDWDRASFCTLKEKEENEGDEEEEEVRRGMRRRR